MSMGELVITRKRAAVFGLAVVACLAAPFVADQLESPTSVRYVLKNADGSVGTEVLDLGEANAAPGPAYAKPGAMSICASDSSVVRVTVSTEDQGIVKAFTCP